MTGVADAPTCTTLTPSCAVDALTAAPAMSTVSPLTNALPLVPVKLIGCVVPTLGLTVTPAEQVTVCVLMVSTSDLARPLLSTESVEKFAGSENTTAGTAITTIFEVLDSAENSPVSKLLSACVRSNR